MSRSLHLPRTSRTHLPERTIRRAAPDRPLRALVVPASQSVAVCRRTRAREARIGAEVRSVASCSARRRPRGHQSCPTRRMPTVTQLPWQLWRQCSRTRPAGIHRAVLLPSWPGSLLPSLPVLTPLCVRTWSVVLCSSAPRPCRPRAGRGAWVGSRPCCALRPFALADARAHGRMP